MGWMRRLGCGLVLVGLLACGVMAAGAQKQRYSASGQVDELYPLTIHVLGSHLSETEPGVLYVTTLIDGLHVQLKAGATGLLHPGDYKARVVANDEKKSGWFTRSYELLFPDRTHVAFQVVGESE